MKLILKIAITLIILFGALTGLEKIYDYGLTHNRNLKIGYASRGKVNADVLIHGPCEALWIINPSVLDKRTGLRSYNLALSHSDFADNYLHLYTYLKYNKKPKYLFLYVTPESMDGNYNTFNSFRFAPYLNDTIVRNVVKECDPDYARWTKLPFLKYAYYNSSVSFNVVQGIKHSFSAHSLPYFPNGFEPPAKITWDNHLEKFIDLYPKGYSFKWDKLREKYLRKNIELAQQYGIKVFLYESPVLKEALPWQKNREEIIGKISDIAKEYNVDYILFDGMEIANSRRYFISTLNMNLEGTSIFSDSLGRYIRKNILNESLK
jgi:hypothetical protein